MGLQTVPEMAPEVLVVGQPGPSEALVLRVREHGYAAEVCTVARVAERLGADRMPGALVLCTDGLDVGAVMKAVRDTSLGAAIVVTLYGALGESIGDLADVLDLGADHFLNAPATDQELVTALEELAGPAAAPGAEHQGLPGGSFGSWPNRTEVIDGPLPDSDEYEGLADSEPLPQLVPEVTSPELSEPSEVLGQLHRTLDMLEQRLRDGGGHGAARADPGDDDLSRYGLDEVPDVGTTPARRGQSAQLGVEEFELPLVSLTSPGARVSRAADNPESTVRLEETGELRTAGAPVADPVTPGRREPLEPELESELSSSVARDRPRRARPLPIDRKGGLDIVEVPRLLWTLHRARYTGRLTLQRGKIEKSIWLDAGNFVFARSNVGHDRLSDGLLRRGVLTRSQYETARSLATREPRRAGHLLVEAGFLKPGELHRVLRIHLARILDSTFPWRSGRWLLVPDEASDEPVQLEDAPALLLAAGIRNRMEPTQIVDLLGGPDMVPRFDAANATVVGMHEVVDLLRMTPSDEVWIERLDGRRSLAELTEQAGADELELFSLVYLLHIMGYVELSREPEPEPRPDLRPEELDTQRIQERLGMSRQLDYFEVLGLDRDACRVDVQRAYTDLSATFADDSLEPGVRRDMEADLRELREALAEARDVLIDDALRGAYLAHLEEP